MLRRYEAGVTHPSPRRAIMLADQLALTSAERTAFLAALEQPAFERGAWPWKTYYLFQSARLRWLQGRYDEAWMFFHEMCEAEASADLPGLCGLREHMRALLLWSEGQMAAAVEAARAALAQQERQRCTRTLADARVLLAGVLLHTGRSDEALRLFGAVLGEHSAAATPDMIAWEGAVFVAPLLRLAIASGTHASFASDVLATLDETGRSATRVPVATARTRNEPLTPGEIEILRLLATGASNQRIAEQLIMNHTSVQSHVASILDKLDVSTRTAAARQAEAMGLI